MCLVEELVGWLVGSFRFWRRGERVISAPVLGVWRGWGECVGVGCGLGFGLGLGNEVFRSEIVSDQERQEGCFVMGDVEGWK